MKKEMKSMVVETVSKAAISMALHVAKAPNQYCPLFLGEPQTDLAIASKDYKKLHDFISNNRI